MLDLRFIADDRLFQPVMLRVQRPDGIRGVRDCGVERLGFLRQAGQRLALAGDAIAQIFDLPLRLQDAARLGAAAARHELRSSEDVTVHSGDGE